MRIDSAGNVGISTSSPIGKFQVGGSLGSAFVTALGNSLGFTRNSINYIAAVGGTSSILGFVTGGTSTIDLSTPERMRIDASGNVGINTTSPETFLQVQGVALGNTAGNTSLISSFAANDGNNSRLRVLNYRINSVTGHTNAELRIQKRVDSVDFGYLSFRSASMLLAPTSGTTALTLTASTTAVNNGLSISSTAVTSPAAADGNVFSGTYTPTLTNVTNLTSSTAGTCQYMRVGNVVTVSGFFDINATASAAVEFGMSLPIASNFSAQRELGGLCTRASTSVTFTGSIVADDTNNRARIRIIQTETAAAGYSFTFTYRII
jgi:hypothetical protein